MSRYAILLAGGSGSRMGAPANKVLLPLRGIPAIVRAAAPFTGLCEGMIVVARAEEQQLMRGLFARFGMPDVQVVEGGADRQASVADGLKALPADCEVVLVHDGARALVTEAVIERALQSVQEHGSGVAAVPVTDTIKRATDDGQVQETLCRDQLYAMQTPQGFRTPLLLAAHRQAEQDGFRGTDDASLLEHAGMPVHLCKGDRENIKLTTPFDLALADAILAARDKEV